MEPKISSAGPGQRSLLRGLLTSPLLLLLLLALSFYWQLGAVPLYDLDEGAFTEATREMLASGNVVTPHRDGEPRYDKPILIYWAQAIAAAFLGFDELSLRLPSALAATLWAIALWFFVRGRLDTPTATVAGLLMVLSLQVPFIAKAAVADALLNLFLALSFFEIYRYYQQADPQRGRRYILRAYLWMALGFLTKGPVALVFPVGVSLLFFLSEAGRSAILEYPLRWLRAAFYPMGWLLFVLVAGPWYLAIYLDDGPGFFRSFFLDHNVGRFDAPMHGHGGFPGYYLVVLPLMVLPFSGWLLSLVKSYRSAWSDPLERFLWLWFLAVILLFSFSGTQLPHYLLYGAVPLFILMARHRERVTNAWLAFLPPLLFFAVLLVLPAIVDLLAGPAPEVAADRGRDALGWSQVTDWQSFLAFVLAGLGGLLGPITALWADWSEQLRAGLALRPHEAALFSEARDALDRQYLLAALATFLTAALLVRRQGVAVWQRLILVGVLQTLLVQGALVPRVFAVLQEPVKEAALLAKSLDRPTVVYRTSMPSFSVYRDAITPSRPPVAGDLVFLRIDKLPTLASDYPDLQREILYQRGAVALVAMQEPGLRRLP